jgi:hypothetical protein
MHIYMDIHKHSTFVMCYTYFLFIFHVCIDFLFVCAMHTYKCPDVWSPFSHLSCYYIWISKYRLNFILKAKDV